MTEVLKYFESRGTRLMTIPRKNQVSDYALGEADYDSCGVNCQEIPSIQKLYQKLCCDKYNKDDNCFREEIYPLVYNEARQLVESDTLGVSRDSLETALNSLFLQKIYEGDKEFRSHINNNHPGSASKTPKESVKRNLAEIWLYYIAERGIDY